MATGRAWSVFGGPAIHAPSRSFLIARCACSRPAPKSTSLHRSPAVHPLTRVTQPGRSRHRHAGGSTGCGPTTRSSATTSTSWTTPGVGIGSAGLGSSVRHSQSLTPRTTGSQRVRPEVSDHGRDPLDLEPVASHGRERTGVGVRRSSPRSGYCPLPRPPHQASATSRNLAPAFPAPGTLLLAELETERLQRKLL